MILMSTTTQPAKPKRRWCRFSLRTLLVVMLVFSVTVGWVGSKMLQARQNRDRVAAVEESVAAIERLGMVVTSEYDERRSQTWLEKQFDDPGDSNDPVGILKVTEAGVAFTLFTDADWRT